VISYCSVAEFFVSDNKSCLWRIFFFYNFKIVIVAAVCALRVALITDHVKVSILFLFLVNLLLYMYSRMYYVYVVSIQLNAYK